MSESDEKKLSEEKKLEEIAPPTTELTDEEAEATKGGLTCRKAGSKQLEF